MTLLFLLIWKEFCIVFHLATIEKHYKKEEH